MLRDYNEYFKAMQKNIIEKTDFIVKELLNNDYNKVIDFGCADGSTTRLLADLFPKIEFIGYDINNDIIALNNKSNSFENITYISPLSKNYENLMRSINRKTMIIFSSVLHEIYTFCNNDEIEKIINYFMLTSGCVAIRDMFYTRKNNNFKNSNIYNNSIEKLKEIKEFKEFKNANQIKNITKKDLLHYFMKVRYKKSWYNELEENYFATDFNNIIDVLKNHYYFVKYDEQYINDFLLKENNLIGILTHSTHRKIILKRL